MDYETPVRVEKGYIPKLFCQELKAQKETSLCLNVELSVSTKNRKIKKTFSIKCIAIKQFDTAFAKLKLL